MIPYDRSVDPPAPFIDVIVRHPMTSQQYVVPAQVDTGADISGIPQRLVDDLGLVAARLNGPELTFDLSTSPPD